MAFYSKTNDVPRDPSGIEKSTNSGNGMLSAVIVLLIIAAAFGLYFMYSGSVSTTHTISAPPVTENAPAPTPAPDTQPPAQTTP